MAFASWKSGKLTRKLSPADTSLYLNADLGVTDWRLYAKNDTQVEFLAFTGRTTISATEFQYTGLTRQLSQTAVPATSTGTGFTWLANQELIHDCMHDQIFDAQNGGTISWNVTLSWNVTATKSFRVPVFADPSARDLAIPVPSNGMECYVTSLWIAQDYIGWVWTSRGSSTTANASTIASGKVEIATQAEVDANTDTGWTGAFLTVLPSNIQTANSSQFISWESLAINDFVMLEIQRAFAFNANIGAVTTNMGDILANTRRSIRIIGNWVSASTLKMSLGKVWAPADSLTVRIETDSAGNPSGTLANVNATSAVTGASIAGTQTDTTMTFGGAFTLTDWVVYHIVTQRGTAPDVANYYLIGWYTRNVRSFLVNSHNGTVWGTAGWILVVYVSYTGMYDTLVVKTNATNADGINFIGSNRYTNTVWTTATIQIDGVRKTFTWLTNNAMYFLANTPWLISATSGTTKAPVWLSESTTVLNISTRPKINWGTYIFWSSTTWTTLCIETRWWIWQINLSAGDWTSGWTISVEYSWDWINFNTLNSAVSSWAIVTSTSPIFWKWFYRFILSWSVRSGTIFYY